MNLLAILLNKLDTTGRDYVSSIILAAKLKANTLSNRV